MPSWVKNDDIWEKAKGAALESHKEGDAGFWAIVASIYKRMGGAVMKKSLESRVLFFDEKLRKHRGEPSTAQTEAGNYRKRTVLWNGLTIKIENEPGSYRRGDGWETRMIFPYGYIRGTTGVDLDEHDVYLGPNLDAPMVYVVHQRKYGDWKNYDEDKTMIGFDSEEFARAAYLQQYDDPRFLGSITPMPVAEFVAKVKATKNMPAMIKSIIFFKALMRSDDHTVDLFSGDSGTHLERKVRKDGVVQNYRVVNADEPAAKVGLLKPDKKPKILLPKQKQSNNSTKLEKESINKPEVVDKLTEGKEIKDVTKPTENAYSELSTEQRYGVDSAMKDRIEQVVKSSMNEHAKGKTKSEWAEYVAENGFGKFDPKATREEYSKKIQENTAKIEGLQLPNGVSLTANVDSISVISPYDETLQTRLKRAGGYWDSENKVWRIPADKADQLGKVFKNTDRV